MSPAPVLISPALTLQDARERMFANEIRHLPVVDDNHLVGVVSQRDLAVVGAALPEQSEGLSVAAAMTKDVYTCGPEAALDVVVSEMVKHRYGCVVVMQDEASDRIAGIFTALDAMRALVFILEPMLKEPSAKFGPGQG